MFQPLTIYLTDSTSNNSSMEEESKSRCTDTRKKWVDRFTIHPDVHGVLYCIRYAKTTCLSYVS